MDERTLEQLHYLDVLKEAAAYNKNVAVQGLQVAATECDRAYFCQEIETWTGVQVLLKQREDMVKNIRLLILESKTPSDVVQAVKENLKDMGVTL